MCVADIYISGFTVRLHIRVPFINYLALISLAALASGGSPNVSCQRDIYSQSSDVGCGMNTDYGACLTASAKPNCECKPDSLRRSSAKPTCTPVVHQVTLHCYEMMFALNKGNGFRFPQGMDGHAEERS